MRAAKIVWIIGSEHVLFAHTDTIQATITIASLGSEIKADLPIAGSLRLIKSNLLFGRTGSMYYVCLWVASNVVWIIGFEHNVLFSHTEWHNTIAIT